MVNKDYLLSHNTELKSPWIISNNIPDLYFVKKVHGFCFNEEGKLLIIQRNNKPGWTLPGGTHKFYETTLDTMVRETIEEASVELFDPQIMAYNIKHHKKGQYYNKDVNCNVLYFAIVTDINKRKKDPSSDRRRIRRFIDPKDFKCYVSIKVYTDSLMQDAVNRYTTWIKDMNDI
jgi:8-oxo-dGTP pyrophosphatase MutT (NUDIX family)